MKLDKDLAEVRKNLKDSLKRIKSLRKKHGYKIDMLQWYTEASLREAILLAD